MKKGKRGRRCSSKWVGANRAGNLEDRNELPNRKALIRRAHEAATFPAMAKGDINVEGLKKLAGFQDKRKTEQGGAQKFFPKRLPGYDQGNLRTKGVRMHLGKKRPEDVSRICCNKLDRTGVGKVGILVDIAARTA